MTICGYFGRGTGTRTRDLRFWRTVNSYSWVVIVAKTLCFYGSFRTWIVTSCHKFQQSMLPKMLPYLVKIPTSHSNKTIISKKPTFAINVVHRLQVYIYQRHSMPPYPRVFSIGPAQKYFTDFHPKYIYVLQSPKSCLEG